MINQKFNIVRKEKQIMENNNNNKRDILRIILKVSDVMEDAFEKITNLCLEELKQIDNETNSNTQ